MGITYIIKTGKGEYGQYEFGISRFPNRKSQCLYMAEGTTAYPLAYFCSDADAELFQKILNDVMPVSTEQDLPEVEE